jgi:hypothetical protein
MRALPVACGRSFARVVGLLVRESNAGWIPALPLYNLAADFAFAHGAGSIRRVTSAREGRPGRYLTPVIPPARLRALTHFAQKRF